jgi:hypothetical protein
LPCSELNDSEQHQIGGIKAHFMEHTAGTRCVIVPKQVGSSGIASILGSQLVCPLGDKNGGHGVFQSPGMSSQGNLSLGACCVPVPALSKS